MAANAQDKGKDKGQENGQDKAGDKKPRTSAVPRVPAASQSGQPPVMAEPKPKPPKPASGGGEVVRLDRFRKK